jgi:hypothetical protein
MFRLRHVVVLMTNAVLVGSLLILVLSVGWVGFVPVFGAVVVGFLLSWPTAVLVARWIKRVDPAWNATVDRPVAAERRYRALRARGLSVTGARKVVHREAARERSAAQGSDHRLG